MEKSCYRKLEQIFETFVDPYSWGFFTTETQRKRRLPRGNRISFAESKKEILLSLCNLFFLCVSVVKKPHEHGSTKVLNIHRTFLGVWLMRKSKSFITLIASFSCKSLCPKRSTGGESKLFFVISARQFW